MLGLKSVSSAAVTLTGLDPAVGEHKDLGLGAFRLRFPTATAFICLCHRVDDGVGDSATDTEESERYCHSALTHT